MEEQGTYFSKSDHGNSTWAIYSSYDLTDTRDGASQHLAEILDVHRTAISAQMFAMKSVGSWPRTSLGHALWTATCEIAKRSLRWRDRRRGFLLGMHSLLLAPLFAPGLYIPLDCWSAREAGLAARRPGLGGLLRRIYALAILACERLLLRRVSRVLVVSQAEKDAYIARIPHIADRVIVLPLRVPKTCLPHILPPAGPNCSVLIWMDARVAYGRESILSCLEELEAWPELKITILSRVDDLGVHLGANRRNLPFVEDLDALLSQQALIILPDSFGSGIKNRALEVAIRGIPMLASPYALQGLGWIPPEDYTWTYSTRIEFREALEAALAGAGRERVERLRSKISTEITEMEQRILKAIEDID